MDSAVGSDHYVLPVSVSQEHLWLLSSIDQQLSAAYNMSAAFKISKPIHRFLLQHAINFIVSRHEALRTAICKVNGVLKQVVDPNRLITLQYVDVIKLDSTPTLREKEILNQMELEAAKPFDLSTPGLFRVSLYRCEEDIFYILLVLHHSIADGLSIEILVKELFLAYQQQTDTDLPQLIYQFADIVAWQTEQLSPQLLRKCTWIIIRK